MTRQRALEVSVTTVIDAHPATIYDLISDITQIHRFSPETVAACWLDGASGPRVGARFRGTNAIGRLRWSTKPTVSAAEPGVRFAFTVPGRSGPEWTYQLAEVPGGTRVTESMCQQAPSPALIRCLQRRAGVTDRAEHLRQGMITTLDRLAAAAAPHGAPTTTKA